MEHLACFHTHAESLLGDLVFSPLDYPKLPRGESRPNHFAKMRALSRSQSSHFSRLPTELILKICEHSSTYDLWHNIRSTSRLLAACAQEVLPRKFFEDSTIHIRWCCFWCSLGHFSLHAACSSITSLFPNADSVEIAMVSDRALMTRIIFGNLCTLVTSRDPKIRIRLGEEERDIKFGSGEILMQKPKHTEGSVQDLRLCQRRFLAWYFARRKQEAAKGRIFGAVGYAAHLLRFIATSIVLLLIGLALTLFACVTMEVFKLLTSLCKGLRNLMRFCLGKGPLPH